MCVNLPREDETQHKDLLRKILARDEDDFVVEFDLNEFDQNSIKISLLDKSRSLNVSAKKEVVSGNTTSTRNFRKEVQVPSNIDLNTLQSKLIEGNLRISGKKERRDPPPKYDEFETDAYVSPENFQADTIESIMHNPFYDSSFEVARPDIRLSSQQNRSKPIENRENKITTLEVNIGVMYKPENVIIKVSPEKIIVEAEREEKLGTQTSKRQFVRNFQMTNKINVWSVEAAATDGIITICACPSQGDMEEFKREIRRKLPISGQRCRVIQES